MKNVKLSEILKIDCENQAISTVAGSSVSKLYDMKGYDQALFLLSMGIKGSSIATISSVAVSLVETSAVSVAGTTLIGGKATITFGGADNTYIGASVGAAAIVLRTAGATSATTNDLFQLGLGTDLITFTFSSIGTAISPTAATSISATAGFFGCGSAVDATANTGNTLLMDSIRTNLQSTRFLNCGPNVFRFTTPDTESLLIEVVNSTKGNLVLSSTMATDHLIGHPMQVAAAIPIRGDQLTASANKRYIGVQWATCAQNVSLGVTLIRSKGRYMPSNFIGILSS